MLSITLPEIELFDEDTNEFMTVPAESLRLEHSLVSLSKWEAKWKKPYLSEDKKTSEEIRDYIRCMSIGKEPNPISLRYISQEIVDEITAYIHDSMTATFLSDEGGPPSREPITSELVYYWMIAQNIPSEFEKWHLNRLLMLIRVCAYKSAPNKKLSAADLNARNKSLNAARRAKLGSSG